MAEEVDLPEAESGADRLHVLDHGRDRVELRILQALGTPRAALVDEHEPVRPRERQEMGQEIVVRGAGAAVDDEERGPAAHRLPVDEDAVSVHETFGLRVHGRGRAGSPGLSAGRLQEGGGGGHEETEGKGGSSNSHSQNSISDPSHDSDSSGRAPRPRSSLTLRRA